MNKDTLTEQGKAEAIKALRGKPWKLKPGVTIYTVLRHCSSSGMMRYIDLCIIRKNRPLWLTHRAAELIGCKMHTRHEGMVVHGGGMDMGFHVVYELGAAMFPNGFKLTKNQHGRNGDIDRWSRNGGYAFEHAWL